ncbi:MAG: hypothetical protein ACRCSU_07880 [Paracoccaceae bacterium]
MATYDEIMKALRRAHDAGDTSAAKRLAEMAKAARPTTDRKAIVDAAKAGTLPRGEVSEDMAREDRKFAARATLGDIGPALSAALGMGQGAMLGFGDEVSAGLAALSPNITYDEALGKVRGAIDLAREQHPIAAYGGEIGSALALPLGAAGSGSLPMRAGKAGITSGILGGVYGFGAGEGEGRVGNAVNSGLLSAAIGGMAPVVGAGVKRGLQGIMDNRAVKAAAKAAPSMDDLRAQASALFQSADNAVLPRQDFANTAQTAVARAERLGMDPMVTPAANAAADRMAKAAASADPNITFRELDTLRNVAGMAADDITKPRVAKIGTEMVESIDDFIDNVDPKLGKDISEARAMWGRLRRSEMVNKAFEKAENAASGFENGLVIEFRAILNSPKTLRGFSEAEIKAMKAVVRGSPFGNLMRQVGKMGIGLNRQSNGLGAMVGGLAGGATLGPVGGLLFPAVGTVAKAGANAAKRAAAERARGLIAAGGATNAGQVPQAPIGLLESLIQRGAIPSGGLLSDYLTP